MAKTAILVDGGFYRKRAAHLWGKKTAEERAKELNAYCMAHLHDKDGNEERQLYRIFYYDCEPVGRRSVYHPLTKKNVDLDKSDTYTWTQTFLEELRKRRKFALRLGTLSNQMAYNLRPDVTRKLLAGTKQLEELTEDDFVFVAQQKGVDMRVGVDIASLAYKKQVDQIKKLKQQKKNKPRPRCYQHRERLQSGLPQRVQSNMNTCIVPPPGRLVKVYPCVWRWIL